MLKAAASICEEHEEAPSVSEESRTGGALLWQSDLLLCQALCNPGADTADHIGKHDDCDNNDSDDGYHLSHG